MPANVVTLAAVVVLPVVRVGDMPHTNRIVDNGLPLPVRLPWMRATVPDTPDGGSVTADGDPHGIARTVFESSPVPVEVRARIDTSYAVPLTSPVREIGEDVDAGDRVVQVAPPSIDQS